MLCAGSLISNTLKLTLNTQDKTSAYDRASLLLALTCVQQLDMSIKNIIRLFEGSAPHVRKRRISLTPFRFSD